jgi:hypothetical protein
MAALFFAALCRRLGWPWGMSGASALLFLFNVSHFRAVHWVSAQCYIVSFMILCAGLLLYLAWVQERRVWGHVGFYDALLCGLLVHTATIELMPLAALAWSRRRPLTATLKQLAVLAAMDAAGVLAIRAYYADSPQVGQLSSAFELWGHLQSLLYMISRLVSTSHVLPFAVFETANGGERRNRRPWRCRPVPPVSIFADRRGHLFGARAHNGDQSHSAAAGGGDFPLFRGAT